MGVTTTRRGGVGCSGGGPALLNGVADAGSWLRGVAEKVVKFSERVEHT